MIECAGMREHIAEPGKRVDPDRLHLQEAMKLRNTAAVLPPPSLPKKVQLPRCWNHNPGSYIFR